MNPLTLIIIVLVAAVLWITVTGGMIAHLAHSERREALREPRMSVGGLGRGHGTRTTRKPKVRRVRPPHRVAMHSRMR